MPRRSQDPTPTIDEWWWESDALASLVAGNEVNRDLDVDEDDDSPVYAEMLSRLEEGLSIRPSLNP